MRGGGLVGCAGREILTKTAGEIRTIKTDRSEQPAQIS